MGRLSADEWKRRALQAEAAWGDMKLDLEGGEGTLAEPEKGMERMVVLVHFCSNLRAAVFTTTCKNHSLAHKLEQALKLFTIRPPMRGARAWMRLKRCWRTISPALGH